MKSRNDGDKHSEPVLAPNDFTKLRPYCSETSIRYLQTSLARLESGAPPTPSFKLYGRSDISVAKEFIGTIGKSAVPDWLKEYEQSRLEKFGPQGGIPKWDTVKDDFLLYKTAGQNVRFVDPVVLDEMKHEYSRLRCQELAARETLDHLKRTDKIETRAAGWSEFQLKKTDPKAQAIALKYAMNGDWEHGYGYVFVRYNKLKRRIFMPMPFSSMILQAKWFIPFLGNIQKSLLLEGVRSPFLAWSDKIGFEQCFDLMEQQLNAANIQENEYLVYFSNDFTKMDTCTGSSQYEEFFMPIMKAAFGNDRMHSAVMFTTTAPIISPSGTMTGDHGTASGAELTNGGETVCNDYFQRRLIRLLVSRCKRFRLAFRRANGDDSVLGFIVQNDIPFDSFVTILKDTLEEVASETGFRVNTEKLDISQTFGKYCQNVFTYDPKARALSWTYPAALILNSIINPEKEYTPAQWDKDYRDIDVVEKLDNGRHHPLYTQLVDYVRHGTKYPLLGKDEPETKRILSKYDKYRSLQSLGERYNRQDYDISKSPTVKYILQSRG